MSIRGIDFLGYRFFHSFTLLRKSIAKGFKDKIRNIKKNWIDMSKTKLVNGIMSYYGWIKYGNCRRLFNKYMDLNVRDIVRKSCIILKQRNPLKEVLV